MLHLELRLLRCTADGGWEPVGEAEGAPVVDEGDRLALEIKNHGHEPISLRLTEKRFDGEHASFYPRDGKLALLLAGDMLTVGADDGAALRLRAPAALMAETVPAAGESLLTRHELRVLGYASAAAGNKSPLHLDFPFAVRHGSSVTVDACSGTQGTCDGDLVPAVSASLPAAQEAVLEALRQTGAKVTPMRPRLAGPGWSESVAASMYIETIDVGAVSHDKALRSETLDLRTEASLPGRGQFLFTSLENGSLFSFPIHDIEGGGPRYAILENLVPWIFGGITHLVDFALAPGVREAALKWEHAFSPDRLRTFGPGVDGYKSAVGRVVTDADWTETKGGRALVFIHGFIDTSYLAFRDIPEDLMKELNKRYDGRVFAFDHSTMTVAPIDNASALLGMVPAGRHVEVDLVCHSRGGLVARALNEQLPAGGPLTVKKIVFAGTPNGGTLVAAADKFGSHFFSALSTMMLRRPTAGLGGVIDSIQLGIGQMAQVFATSAFSGLPGLKIMDPTRIATEMNRHINTRGAQYFAIGAAFDPRSGVLGRDLAKFGKAFYGAPNDLVVPTYSVAYAADRPTPPTLFPLAIAPLFFTDGAVYHDTIFAQQKTIDLLRDQLTG